MADEDLLSLVEAAGESMRIRPEVSKKVHSALAQVTQRPGPFPAAQIVLKAFETSSRAVHVRCDDDMEYVVKGYIGGRGVVNDQVIARLGMALSAPVGTATLVDLSLDLIEVSPELRGVCNGLAHATGWIAQCSDGPLGRWVDDDNVVRFASLAVLYGWCDADDHQVLYANDEPHLVWSVDHGHFFPGGTGWTTASFAGADPPRPDQTVVTRARVPDKHLVDAIDRLKVIDDDTICRAVAWPPQIWGVTLTDREALAQFLIDRRDTFSL